MKLYYSPGSCSMSCHIALEESGLKYEAIRVDFDNANDPAHKAAMALHPLGTLPVLVLDDGKFLTQNLSILTYVGDQAAKTGTTPNAKKLIPTFGTFERDQTMNWLSFVAADLHKSVGAFFGVSSFSTDTAKQTEYRKYLTENADRTLTFLNRHLATNDYIMGNEFTVVDAYAFVVTGWTKHLDISLEPYANLQKYLGRMVERAAVMTVMKAEGLV